MGKRDEKVAKDEKPIYKKWWFWLIVILLFSGLANSLTAKNDKKTTSSERNTLNKSSQNLSTQRTTRIRKDIPRGLLAAEVNVYEHT